MGDWWSLQAYATVKSQEQLNDLRDKRDFLARKTGQEPLSWYEFKQEQPAENPPTLRNMGIGGVIGLAVGVALALFLQAPAIGVPLALSGLITGSAIGMLSDTGHQQRDAVVKKYESYLENFASTATLSPYLAATAPLQEGHHAARLREQEPARAHSRAK